LDIRRLRLRTIRFVLGNALITEVRTSGQHFAAAYNIVSDKRLKVDFASVPDDVAIEFSRNVSFTSFMRIRDVEKITAAYDQRLAQLHNELMHAEDCGNCCEEEQWQIESVWTLTLLLPRKQTENLCVA
jgi:hypothetical protein